jgi:hypothetical protein
MIGAPDRPSDYESMANRPAGPAQAHRRWSRQVRRPTGTGPYDWVLATGLPEWFHTPCPCRRALGEVLVTENFWWLADPQERYWVETLSERRPTLGRQLHAPQADGAGQPNWRYDLVRAARPGDVVLHWLNDRGTRGFAGWSIVAAPATPRPIVWHARGTYGRRRARLTREQPGWWVPLKDFRAVGQPLGLDALNNHRAAITAVH